MSDCEHIFIPWRSYEVCQTCGLSKEATLHDPLCEARNKEMIKHTYCTSCQLIKKAREDERKKIENS